MVANKIYGGGGNKKSLRYVKIFCDQPHYPSSELLQTCENTRTASQAQVTDGKFGWRWFFPEML